VDTPAPAGPAPASVHLVVPRSFNDAQQIADKFKDAVPVILNLQSSDAELSKRLIDFASGLTYALEGGMQRVGDKVFLLTPRNVEVRAEERARAARARRLLQPGVGSGCRGRTRSGWAHAGLSLLADAISTSRASSTSSSASTSS
jgi:FtsZ-interacting cell division protein YlmF